MYLKNSEEPVKKIFYINKNIDRRNYEEEVTEILEGADRVLENAYLFRHPWDMERTNITYTFEEKVIWDTNPFGDPEWTYMLNRHREFIYLTKAYYFTKDKKYLDKFCELIESFIDDNHDKNLTYRRIEVGIRLENWIVALEFVRNQIGNKLLLKILNSIEKQCNYINESFNSFSETSNWGIIEFHGLLVGGLFLSDNPQRGEWILSSLEKLYKCFKIQVLPDGTQWEQSPLYHNEVFRLGLNVLYFYKRGLINISRDFVDIVENMARANTLWMKPNGHIPLWGDSDDISLKDLMSYSVMIFGKKIKDDCFTKMPLEYSFMFTNEELEVYENLGSIEHEKTSHYFSDCGLYVGRSKETYINFYLKNLGGGHSHDDMLGFTFFTKGKDYILDGGRFSYVDNELRKELKSSKAHNSFTVDGEGFSLYDNTWANSFEGNVTDEKVVIAETYDYIQGATTAFLRLEDPVYAKRKAVFIKETETLIIIDNFRSKEKHNYEVYFNFPYLNLNFEENRVIAEDLSLINLDNLDISLEESQYSMEYNSLNRGKRIILKTEDSSRTMSTIVSRANLFGANYLDVLNNFGEKLEKEVALCIELEFEKCKYRVFIREDMKPSTNFFRVENSVYIEDYKKERIEK